MSDIRVPLTSSLTQVVYRWQDKDRMLFQYSVQQQENMMPELTLLGYRLTETTDNITQVPQTTDITQELT